MSSVVSSAVQEEILRFGPFQLSAVRRQLLLEGQPVSLGSRSFALLLALVEHAGEVLSKDTLMRLVWPDSVVEDSNLRVHMAALRKALGVPAGGGQYILNIPLRGYSFVATVERLRPASSAAEPPPPQAHRPVPRLPAALTRLFGRDEVIADLVRRLPEQRHITLVGPGGAGKTSASLAAARQLESVSADGAWFIDLAALEDGALVPSAFVTALGIQDSAATPIPAIVSFLAGKRALLLVDNCERVVLAVAQMCEALLSALSQTLILATSREPLLSAGEHVYRLAPLKLPPSQGTLTREQYLAYPSVQLFIERAAATGDGFEADAASLATIARICRRLDGMPLAIELAAARVESFGIGGLATTLDEHILVLSGGRRTAPARHQTIGATLNWSYQTLSAEEQRVLRRLSAFQAMFGLDAALDMFASDERLRVPQLVSELVLKSLLTADVSSEQVRYRMLDATRAFAWERLVQAGERDEAGRLHAAHCGRLAHAIKTTWPGTSASEAAATWLADSARRLDDLRLAFEWSLAHHDVALACQLLGDASELWFQLALTAEFLGRAERALSLLRLSTGVDPMVELTLCAGLSQAMVHSEGSGSQRLLEMSERVLAMARAIGHVVFEKQMLFRLWNAAVANGHYADSLALARQYQAVSLDPSDQNDALLIDRMLMLSLHTLGAHEAARDHSTRILEHRAIRERSLRTGKFQIDHKVIALCFRAKILWVLGWPEQAWRTAEEAVAESQLTGHLLAGMYARGMGTCLIALWNGDLAAADAHVAVMARESVGHSLAYWDAWSRCFDKALTHLGHKVPADRPRLKGMDGRPLSGMQEEVLATMSDDLLTDEVIARAGVLAPDSWSVPEIFRRQAERLLATGEPSSADEADRLLRRSAQIAADQAARSWQLRTAMSRAGWHVQRDERGQAVDALAPVLDAFTEGHATADLVKAHALLRTLQSAV